MKSYFMTIFYLFQYTILAARPAFGGPLASQGAHPLGPRTRAPLVPTHPPRAPLPHPPF